MASISLDAAAAKRTFANVAASASIPAQTLGLSTSNNINDDHQPSNGTINGAPPNVSHPPENARISPAIPKKLVQNASKPLQTPLTGVSIETKPLIQSPGVNSDRDSRLSGPTSSGLSDENSTQFSSSDTSAKPASLDGKSVASGTTFAMDEKESLRPDDSASVKAIEDEDVYSPPDPAAVDSQFDSETGARAFRDQLQEITSMGPPAARPPIPASRPDSRSAPIEALLYTPSALPLPGQLPVFAQPPQALPGKPAEFPPDQKLLEAISNPRDRIWVLKLEQDIIDFVKDSKEPFVDLPQCNSFYRMLAHKLADYYLLGHAVESTVASVRLYRTPTCRIAPPLGALTNPSTASNTPPPSAPQVKILRRGGEATLSKASSETGDSDGDKAKTTLTREEREQRYEQARLRIMGSAKPEVDSPASKEKDESRSSSAAGKKKPKKQRTNSEDGFEARSAYSTYNPTAPYAHSSAPENSGTPAYYHPYTEHGPGMYNTANAANVNAYTPQTYNAVYGGQNMPSQAQYPWLQQNYSSYSDTHNQHWDQSSQNGNDLSADFQQAMSFQQANMHGSPSTQSQAASFGFANQGQPQQSWSQGVAPNYPMSQGFPSYGASDRPTSSASHGSQYGYGVSGQYMGYGNAAMNGGFRAPAFNPNSQAFIPGYQATSGPQNFMVGMGGTSNGYSSYGPMHALQRQESSQSQGSLYNGQRSNNDNGNGRVSSAGMMHPLPQPVFSPNVTMPQPTVKTGQSTPSRPPNGNGATERSPGPANGSSGSTIAKWGTPASLPAKPPPPASESLDMNRLQGQRAPGFNTAAAARLPGMGAPGYHSLPSMAGMRGGAGGQGARNGQ